MSIQSFLPYLAYGQWLNTGKRHPVVIALPGILKSTSKVIFIIISTIVGIAIALFTWTVLKPIIRAIGWLISAVTILAILYWLLI